MKYVSVCSGIEAATNAWHRFGWTPVAFSEIEKFPAAVLAHRFPNIPNYGDLTQYKSWPIEPGSIDLLVGGTPCQSFSVAGLRKGLADPRGNLCLTFLGLADHLRPRWILWENVVGVLSSGGGRDFGAFLGALGQLGYGWSYRVLKAEHFGVPQRRRRVFVLAHRDPVTGVGDWRIAAEALSIGEGLQRYLEKGKPSRKKSSSHASSSIGESGGDGSGNAGVGAGCWWDGGQVSQTLDAVLAKGQTMPEKNRFPAVLQPVCATGNITHCLTASAGKMSSEDGTGRGVPIVIDRAAFNQGENAQYEPHIGESEVMDTVVARGPHAVGQVVPFRKSKRAQSEKDDETWVPADASNTLNNFDLGDTRTTHAVVSCSKVSPTVSSGAPFSKTGNERVEVEALVTTFKPHIVQASELRIRGEISEQQTVPTLLASTKSGDNDPLAVHAISFQPGNLRRKGGADPSMETFPTLTKDSGDQSPHVAVEMVVRRLSVNECLRLQGFPDNWTNIPWKGKPEGEAPDGPQYKCAGNSMAVPCMSWIAEGIIRVEAKLKAKA